MTAQKTIATDWLAELEQLEDFFQNAPVGLLLSDPAGTPLTYNRAFALLTGLPWPERLPAPQFQPVLADGQGPADVPGLLRAEEPVSDLAISVRAGNGVEQTLLANASAYQNGNQLAAVRWVVRPILHKAIPSIEDDPTEYLLPSPKLIAENDAALWAARLGPDTDVRPVVRSLNETQAKLRYAELDDFITNAPAAIHLINVRGTVLRSNKIDLAVAGYADAPEEFIGGDVRRVYADHTVLEDLLGRWDSDRPTLNFRARLVSRKGIEVPVVIFSNSRIVDGEFQNTRDVVVLDPDPDTPPTPTRRFRWPHN